MTTTEKDVQIALGLYLQEVWKERCRLHAAGYKLYDEGYKLYDEGDKSDEGLKCCAKGYKLIIEGNTLCADGEWLFYSAVAEVYGKDMSIKWTDYGCMLGNGIELNV